MAIPDTKIHKGVSGQFSLALKTICLPLRHCTRMIWTKNPILLHLIPIVPLQRLLCIPNDATQKTWDAFSKAGQPGPLNWQSFPCTWQQHRARNGSRQLYMIDSPSFCMDLYPVEIEAERYLQCCHRFPSISLPALKNMRIMAAAPTERIPKRRQHLTLPSL